MNVNLNAKIRVETVELLKLTTVHASAMLPVRWFWIQYAAQMALLTETNAHSKLLLLVTKLALLLQWSKRDNVEYKIKKKQATFVISI